MPLLSALQAVGIEVSVVKERKEEKSIAGLARPAGRTRIAATCQPTLKYVPVLPVNGRGAVELGDGLQNCNFPATIRRSTASTRQTPSATSGSTRSGLSDASRSSTVNMPAAASSSLAAQFDIVARELMHGMVLFTAILERMIIGAR